MDKDVKKKSSVSILKKYTDRKKGFVIQEWERAGQLWRQNPEALKT